MVWLYTTFPFFFFLIFPQVNEIVTMDLYKAKVPSQIPQPLPPKKTKQTSKQQNQNGQPNNDNNKNKTPNPDWSERKTTLLLKPWYFF